MGKVSWLFFTLRSADGATEFYNKYGGEGGGIPFFLIFNKKGILLADSKIKATKVKSTEKTAITERFKKNRS